MGELAQAFNMMALEPKKGYMTFEEFFARAELREIFNLNKEHDVEFIKKRLLMHQPRHYDCPGWIYVYYRKVEEDRVRSGAQSWIEHSHPHSGHLAALPHCQPSSISTFFS